MNWNYNEVNYNWNLQNKTLYIQIALNAAMSSFKDDMAAIKKLNWLCVHYNYNSYFKYINIYIYI